MLSRAGGRCVSERNLVFIRLFRIHRTRFEDVWAKGRMAWSVLSDFICVTLLLVIVCLCDESDKNSEFNSHGNLRFTTDLPAWIFNSHPLSCKTDDPFWKLKWVLLSFLSGLRLVKNWCKIKITILTVDFPSFISCKVVPRLAKIIIR